MSVKHKPSSKTVVVISKSDKKDKKYMAKWKYDNEIKENVVYFGSPIMMTI